MCVTLPLLLGVISAPLVANAANPPSGNTSVSGQQLHWTGTATTFGNKDESTCVEGVNCDTFTINVGGTTSDWMMSRQVIRFAIDWQIPANDYDLYIHKDSNTGPVVGSSANGAPSTEEAAIIDPSLSGVGTYTVHVVYFAGTPGVDQYVGTATVMGAPSPTYIHGGFTFSDPRTVSAPASTSDGEPSSRCDRFGNYYVAGIRGVPAGVDLWYFDLRPTSNMYDPYLRNPIYRGQPDSFTGDEAYEVGADGGGDVDIAVGFPPSGIPTLAFTSLTAANISASVSHDLGQSWQKNPLGNVTGGLAVDDRQWLEFYGANTVYLLYRTFQPAVTQIQQSTDGGLTWGAAKTAGQIGQVGSCAVDQRDGTVYIAGSDGKVAVGVPDPITHEPTTYNVYQVVSSGDANIFLVVKVAPDGTAYLCYSDGLAIYLTYSNNKGQNWSVPARVSDGPETATSLLPWMECGPVPGSVGIVWYGTSAGGNVDSADWQVFFAQSMNANTTTPTFTEQAVTPYSIHNSNISLGGTLGSANRNLLDYFQISFDTQGQALIAYTDDHNDYDGCVYVTHQIGGPTVNGGTAGTPVEGSALPPEKSGGSGPQVTDPAMDVTDAALVVLPQNDPLDILSVQYSVTPTRTDKVLTAQMKVSDLSSIPASAGWQMSFAMNTPTLSAAINHPGFSYLAADRGDEFYLEADTSLTGAVTYTWGTATRGSDGSITYTSRGTADSGSIDPISKTITVSVSASKLAPYCTHGPALLSGSYLCGLRGHTFVSGPVAARYDRTRGGGQLLIP